MGAMQPSFHFPSFHSQMALVLPCAANNGDAEDSALLSVFRFLLRSFLNDRTAVGIFLIVSDNILRARYVVSTGMNILGDTQPERFYTRNKNSSEEANTHQEESKENKEP